MAEWKCPVCGGELPLSEHGRYRDYCSNRCKQRAYRRRRAGARLDTPPIPGSRLSAAVFAAGTSYDLSEF